LTTAAAGRHSGDPRRDLHSIVAVPAIAADERRDTPQVKQRLQAQAWEQERLIW